MHKKVDDFDYYFWLRLEALVQSRHTFHIDRQHQDFYVNVKEFPRHFEWQLVFGDRLLRGKHIYTYKALLTKKS